MAPENRKDLKGSKAQKESFNEAGAGWLRKTNRYTFTRRTLRCFNEAGAGWLRKTYLSPDAFGIVPLASMRPEPVGSGKRLGPFCLALRAACFNEAGAGWLRKTYNRLGIETSAKRLQ